jgi:MFS family permease
MGAFGLVRALPGRSVLARETGPVRKLIRIRLTCCGSVVSKPLARFVKAGHLDKPLHGPPGQSARVLLVIEVKSDVRWFNRAVGGIGAASFLADVGHEVPTSLLPRFLTSTLGGPAAALGLIEGIADGLAGLARLAGGALADDPDRRKMTAVGGYTSTAVLTGAIGLASNVWMAGALRATGWMARGLRVPARNALLADAVPTSAYGRAYGFERALDNLGAIAGPALALLLVSIFSTRIAMLISIIPGLLAALVILFAIRHLPSTERREHQPFRIRIRPVLQSPLRGLLAGIGAFEIGNVAATLLILRTSELITPDKGIAAATRTALLLYLGYNIAATLTSLVAGRMIDRSGSRGILLVGVAAFAFAYAMFAGGPTDLTLLALAFALAGIGIGCIETAEHSAVAARAPSRIRGSAFGLLAALQSFGNLAASSVAGLLWTVVSAKAAFFYLAVWMVLAFFLLARTRAPAASATEKR